MATDKALDHLDKLSQRHQITRGQVETASAISTDNDRQICRTPRIVGPYRGRQIRDLQTFKVSSHPLGLAKLMWTAAN
jgi:hypothetical protein